MKKPSTAVLLALGANLGDRELALYRAISLLVERRAIYAPVLSSVYETEPVGHSDQPSFLNMAVLAGTLLLPAKLLAVCKDVERQVGRVERPRWHEREIDIDLALYHNRIITQEQFAVPHPHMHQRRFVLEPAAEIAPDMVHPVLRKTVAQLLADCTDAARVHRLGELNPRVLEPQDNA